MNYLATEEERKEYSEILKNNEEQYQNFLSKKYSIENVFNKRKNSINISQEYSQLPIEYKETFFKSILNKIKKLFRKVMI